jgi:hypothetical protein
MLRTGATLHVATHHWAAHDHGPRRRVTHDLYAADLFTTTLAAIATIAVVTITLANRNANQEDQHTQRDK